MGKWADLADKLRERDKNDVDGMNYGFFGGVPTIEARIELANNRAKDALVAVTQILGHLDKIDEAVNLHGEDEKCT